MQSAAGERVADIFFSYSSQDRERVRRVRDALADKGFDVFLGPANASRD
jgi:hypothetical protein